MKVCFIAEGCYPYVVGGVSSWIHSMIRTFPEIEFSLIAILSNRSQRRKFVYELPENLTAVYEVYLQDVDWSKDKQGLESDRLAWMQLPKQQYQALRSLVLNEEIDWSGFFALCQDPDLSVNRLLMSPAFLSIIKEYYLRKYQNITFSDFLWTMRSIYLPMFLALKIQPPRADIYHCVATGYAGLIGSMAKELYPESSLLISEHGIYTREREEELIRARWVQGIYKDIWISQFQKMARCAYDHADQVTALYEHARELQMEFGCPREKTMVTPNGIQVDRFVGIPMKDPDDPYIHVGAILRITPIKDVKTLINAFYYAHQKNPALKLWVMGPDDEDEQYARECYELVDNLKAENVEFTGRINTLDYIGRMDMTILTSISEGQPLTILEGYAVKKPCIATNVGNCYGLIYGEDDDFGPAGSVVPVMNIAAITDAILRLAGDQKLREEMGENGYKRLMRKYKIEYMKDQYHTIYQSLAKKESESVKRG
jgi:glycosyltransferase involved in cell wall biosynthesis